MATAAADQSCEVLTAYCKGAIDIAGKYLNSIADIHSAVAALLDPLYEFITNLLIAILSHKDMPHLIHHSQSFVLTLHVPPSCNVSSRSLVSRILTA